MKRTRKKIHYLLSPPDRSFNLSWFIDLFIILLIVINILAIILKSVDSYYQQMPGLFDKIEIISIIFFSIEYVLRIWTADFYPDYSNPPKGNLKYAATPMMLIDLLAILPFYLPFIGLEFQFLRIMRILRIFRILRLLRFTHAMDIVYKVYAKKIDYLALFSLLTVFVIIIFSILLFYIENRVQPEQFNNIPNTLWWVMGVLSTVGYGEISPITALGKFIMMIVSFTGILLFGYSAAIIASGFSELMDEIKEKKK